MALEARRRSDDSPNQLNDPTITLLGKRLSFIYSP